jgi:hypothetical protein
MCSPTPDGSRLSVNKHAEGRRAADDEAGRGPGGNTGMGGRVQGPAARSSGLGKATLLSPEFSVKFYWDSRHLRPPLISGLLYSIRRQLRGGPSIFQVVDHSMFEAGHFAPDLVP